MSFPENKLEELLIKAVNDYSYREEFYIKLLWSELLVVTRENNNIGAEITLTKDTLLPIITLENGQVPVFTSVNRIFDNGIIKEKAFHVRMKGQDLFNNLLKGANIIINPFSDHSVNFTPQQIENLLNGNISEVIKFEEETQIQIIQPQYYPYELANALIKLFKEMALVNAAYLALARENESDINPYLLIGLDIEGNLMDIINVAGPITEKHLKKGETIKFIQIKNTETDEPISNYFINETLPFYIKPNYSLQYNLEFLCSCNNPQEVKYFIDELEAHDIKYYLEKEKTQNSLYPIEVGDIHIWVAKKSIDKATNIYNLLTGYDETANNILHEVDDNSEEFVELRKKGAKVEKLGKWFYFFFIVGFLLLFLLTLIFSK